MIVLADRTLIIMGVTTRPAADSRSTLVKGEVTVINTSRRAIENRPTFFVLMDSQGDAFGLETPGLHHVFGPVSAHKSKTVPIRFVLPRAAVTPHGLQLEYRPEIPSEVVIVTLRLG